MFDNANQHMRDFAEPVDELETDALLSLLQPVTPALMAPANPGFELPRGIWMGMLGSYVVFFIAIAAATGGSARAVFAIVISVLYAAMFFGTARLIARQAGDEARSPLERGKPLQTWCGPMEPKAVYGQVLVVPMAIASFAIGIAAITAFIL